MATPLARFREFLEENEYQINTVELVPLLRPFEELGTAAELATAIETMDEHVGDEVYVAAVENGFLNIVRALFEIQDVDWWCSIDQAFEGDKPNHALTFLRQCTFEQTLEVDNFVQIFEAFACLLENDQDSDVATQAVSLLVSHMVNHIDLAPEEERDERIERYLKLYIAYLAKDSDLVGCFPQYMDIFIRGYSRSALKPMDYIISLTEEFPLVRAKLVRVVIRLNQL